jgi:quercetin dioxygenase-like cupin family protein
MLFVGMSFGSCTLYKNKNKETSCLPSSVFPLGEITKTKNFTGTVWLQSLVKSDSIYNMYAGSVHFEPGARTHWHFHPGGQILLVTSGIGLYQEKGQSLQKIKKGDVIQCPPNIIHWHGASPDCAMTHIAIGTNPARGPVVWLAPVTDNEYYQLK